MLSQRYYDHQCDKLIHRHTLNILNEQLQEKYKATARDLDRQGSMCIGLLALVLTGFNSFLCFMFDEHSFTWLYAIQIILISNLFALHARSQSAPWLLEVQGPLSLLACCLCLSEYETDIQAVFYSCNFKAALYLMIAAHDGNFIYRCLVATLTPLGVLIGFHIYRTEEEYVTGNDEGYAVFAR